MDESPTPRRLRRSTTDRRVAGVAGGIGDYFGIDPVLVRVGFVLAVFAGGAGLLAYLVGWLVIPEDDGTGGGTGPASREVTTITGIVLLALAVIVLVDGWWWTGDVGLPLLLIGAGAWLLLRDGDRQEGDASVDTSTREEVAATVGTAGAVPSPPPPPAPTSGGAPLPPTPPSGPPTARITTAVVALVAGGFGLAAAAGAHVSAEVVLLACLGVTAAGLLVGTFTGRARSLVVLAVPLVAALSLVSAVDIPLSGGIGDRRFEPETLAELDPVYELTAGTLVVDLRNLPDRELEGATAEGPLVIEARLGVGELDILTPSDVTVRADVTVAVGQVDLFGEVDDGTNLDVMTVQDGSDGAPVLDLVVRVGFGEVQVR